MCSLKTIREEIRSQQKSGAQITSVPAKPVDLQKLARPMRQERQYPKARAKAPRLSSLMVQNP